MSTQDLEGFSISPQQKRIWLQDGGFPSRFAVEVEGPLDKGALKEAVAILVARHEILRTVLPSLSGMRVPVQAIEDSPRFQWNELTLEGPCKPHELFKREAFAVNSVSGPVLSVSTAQMGPDHHLLLFETLAVLMDADSWNVFFNELCHLYAGRDENELDEEPVQYADFTDWQYELLEEPDADFWRGQDIMVIEDQELFIEEKYGDRMVLRRHEDVLLPETLSGCRELAEQYGLSVYELLSSCWMVLLSRLLADTENDGQKLVIGKCYNLRNLEALATALGPFSKYIPISCAVGSGYRFHDFLEKMTPLFANYRGKQTYFDWPLLPDVHEEAKLSFGFQVDTRPEPQKVQGTRFTVAYKHVQEEFFKLKLVLIQRDQELGILLEYDNMRYTAQRIAHLMESFKLIAGHACKHTENGLNALPLVGLEASRLLLHERNATQQDYPLNQNLAQAFETKAERTPDAVAVIFEDQTLTYSQLSTRANQVAHALLSTGLKPDMAVPIIASRSVAGIVSLLAVLKAGAAYLPINPFMPEQRIAATLQVAAVTLALFPKAHRNLLNATSIAVVDPERCNHHSQDPPSAAVSPQNPAYVIFTSGSTGKPKGILTQHQAVLNLAYALHQFVYDRKTDAMRLGLNAPLVFDASVKQLTRLLFGDSLTILPEEIRPDGTALKQFLQTRCLDGIDLTPAQVRLMIDADQSPLFLPKRVLIGGEALDESLWEAVGRHNHCKGYNVYGPTECTDVVTVQPIKSGQNPSIGRPLGNLEVYVLDNYGNLVPDGMPGELCVGGAGVAIGYLGMPQLTARVFVPDPFTQDQAGARLYRTGDRVRYLPNGTLSFIGRTDDQVKLRGYRIELGEITGVLTKHPSVRDGAVIVRETHRTPTAPAEKQLIAYFVPEPICQRTFEGSVRHDLPNGLAMVQQNPNETDYLYEEIFYKKTYAFYGITLPENPVVLDIGANIGMYTLFVLVHRPTAHVYAFEPLAPIYETLRLNMALYGKNVQHFNFGLSDREQEVSFNYYPRYSMMSSASDYARPGDEVEVVKRFLEREAEMGSRDAEHLLAHADELLQGRFEGTTHQCLLRRLDDVIREENIGHIDILKVDVQRAEMEVLLGLSPENWRIIDQVVMEVHAATGEESENRLEEITRLLNHHGFQVIAEQDELLVGTDRYNLYARKNGLGELEASFQTYQVDQRVIDRARPLTSEMLHGFLKDRLPDYMLPNALVALKSLPLNNNGKVDVKALPDPGQDSLRANHHRVPPKTPLEEILLGVWHEVLNRNDLGVTDNFFELGGHSLLATQVISRIRYASQVEMPLRAIFEAPTVRAMASLVQAAQHEEHVQAPPITTVNRDQPLPLSFAQQRLWFLYQLDPGSFAYNSLISLRLRGNLSLTAFTMALNRMIWRHEILRTQFVMHNGEPGQSILPPNETAFSRIDLRHLPAGPQQAAVINIGEAEARTPFNLEKGPLLRVHLLTLGENNHILFAGMHHIICDGWSMGVFVNEFGGLYLNAVNPREAEMPPKPSIQYADFAVWQREWLQGEMLQSQLNYWSQKLTPPAEPLDLPAAGVRPAAPSNRGQTLTFVLSPGLTNDMVSLSREMGLTLFMTVLAGFKLLLYRYSGQTDVTTGTVIANRNRAEIEPLIGFFVNTLALRVDLSGKPGFRQLLETVRDTTLGAYAHQDLPFEKIVEALQPDRHLNVTPFFQAMCVLQNTPMKGFDLPGLALEPIKQEDHTAKFELLLLMSETPEGLHGSLNFSTDLFDASTMNLLIRHFQALLEGALQNPDAPIDAIPMLSASEKRLLLDQAQEQTSFHDSPAVHQSFLCQVLRQPDSIALVHEREQLSYQALNQQANILAAHLRRAGVHPDVRVGLSATRSTEIIIAILGILKAGGAYVPLDPSYPEERLRYIQNDAQITLILTHAETPLGCFGETCRVMNIPNILADAGSKPSFQSTDPEPESLAYIIYTSGSTGRPKGVMVTHSNVARLFSACADHFAIGSQDVWTLFHSYAFDFSVWEIWGALVFGGRLVIVPHETSRMPGRFYELLCDQSVTMLSQTPSAFAGLLQTVEAEKRPPLQKLQHVVFGGEAFDPRAFQGWYRLMGVEVRHLVNMYGITETTVHVTRRTMEPGDLRSFIGPPLPDLSLYIFDHQGTQVPLGVPGEIYVGGPGLARGYWNRPGLTAARFLPNPHALKPGARLYRTGDKALRLADGEIVYLGRVDHQVKIRGFRIELGEIESELRCVPSVLDACVVVQEREDDKRLCAFLLVKDQDVQPIEDVRAALSGKLPAYMIPTAFTTLTALPRTPSGKIDRRALLSHEVQANATRQYSAPRNAHERQVADLFSRVLGVERVGVHDDFFSLGGHSLLATRLVALFRQECRLQVELRTLFESPTVEALAALLEGRDHATQPDDTTTPISPKPREGRLPLSFAQKRMWFLNRLDPNQATYNIPLVLRLSGPLDLIALEESLTHVHQRHESLRTRIEESNGKPYQAIDPPAPFNLPIVDLTTLSAQMREPAVEALLRLDAEHPFNLEKGHLLRASVLRLAQSETLLLVNMHHIISDGWSLGVLIQEIGACYSAFARQEESPNLIQPTLQYADFALWQAERFQDGHIARGLEYWRHAIGENPSRLSLPNDHPYHTVETHAGETHRFTIPQASARAIQELGREHGLTNFMSVLAVFQTLLYRYSGQETVRVGSPISGRDRLELEPMIGLFVNTLVLCGNFTNDPSFKTVLDRTRQAAVGAFDHQETPFEMLVDALQTQRDISHPPLFQVSFEYGEGKDGETLYLPGLVLCPVKRDSQIAKFELSLSVTSIGGELQAELQYNHSLFQQQTAVRMAGHLCNLFASVAEDPALPVSTRPMLSMEERRQLLDWGTKQRDFQETLTIPDQFAQHAVFQPHATALYLPANGTVQSTDLYISFGELNQQADHLAGLLRQLGVAAESRVAICMPRTPQLIVCLLGVMKAGGAYVPLDEEYPDDRLAFMLEDSDAKVLLVEEAWVHRFSGTPTQIIPFPTHRTPAFPDSPTSAVAPIKPNDLANVIYTSGTTGRPKGVMVEHRNLQNFAAAVREMLPLTSRDCMPCYLSFSFDIFFFQLFTPLLAGGTCILFNRQQILELPVFVKLLEGFTCWHSTPGFMRQVVTHLLQEQIVVPRPRYVFVGGDTVAPDLLTDMRDVFPNADIFQDYGPTEGTILCSSYRVPRQGKVTGHPIGTPLANIDLRIYDSKQNLVPIGVPGELYIGGAGVTRGYMNQPQLTAQRFIAIDERRFYRSGDLACWRHDGQIHFLGRVDKQIKVRGFRIEPAEIECVLRELPNVVNAAVVGRVAKSGEKRLVAYWVPKGVPDAEPLRTAIRNRLPAYMMPAAFVELAHIPITANGKLDQNALPDPTFATQAFTPPRDEKETLIVRVWMNILGLEQIGIHDNFFELGGDSIIAIQVIARTRQQGLKLKVRDIFQHQTPAKLAASAVFTRQDASACEPIFGQSPLTPIQAWFFQQDFPAPHHFNQSLMFELAVPDPRILHRAVEAVAAHHDSLQLNFVADANGMMHQMLAQEPRDSGLFEYEDLSNVPSSQHSAAIETFAAQFQAGLNLEQGSLFRCAYLHLEDKQPGRLLIVAHHLIVDAVSWRVLLEDLQNAYQSLVAGETPQLPARTTAFTAWSHFLSSYAAQSLPHEECTYWLEHAAQSPPSFSPEKTPTAHRAPVFQELSQVLEPKHTQDLLYEPARVYRAQINETLLTALARALHNWNNRIIPAIELEGHGREELAEDLDISRTVGWFAATYPVVLNPGNNTSPGDALLAIKEQLRSIPNQGLGYGLLRYLSPDADIRDRLSAMPQPPIRFNYMGRLDNALGNESNETAVLQPARENKGPNSDPANDTGAWLSFNCQVAGGALSLSLQYREDLFTRASAERLLSGFRDALRELADHCAARESVSFSPSDFPLAKLDAETLSRLTPALQDAEDVYPLSPLQAGLYFQQTYQPESRAYFSQFACTLCGPLDHQAFRRALQWLTDNTTILRTYFPTGNLDQPRQAVRRTMAAPLTLHDFSGQDAEERNLNLVLFKEQDRAQGFDLSQGPLFRIAVITLGPDRSHLVFSNHHIIMDGWSLSLVYGRLMAAYQAFAQNQVPDLPTIVPYAAFIKWLDQRSRQETRDFWRHDLEGFSQTTPLPFQTKPQSTQIRAVESQCRELDNQTYARLKQLGKLHKITLSTLLQGMWALLLSRFSGSQDVLFGVTVSGRPPELSGVASMIGLFINTLPMRVHVDEDAMLWPWLNRLQSEQVRRREFEHISLADAQRFSQVPGGMPLFNSLFVFENYPVDQTVREKGAGFTVEDVSAAAQTDFPMTIEASANQVLRILIRYDARLFSQHDIAYLGDRFVQLLSAVCAQPDTRLDVLPLLSRSEKEQAIARLHGDWGQDIPFADIWSLFEACARMSPNAPAIDFENQVTSYRQLQQHAQRIAAALSAHGVQAQDHIGLFVTRSHLQQAAIFGVLQTGAAFVPLHPSYPHKRRATIVEDARISLILCTEATRDLLPDGVTPIQVDVLLEDAAVPPPAPIQPESIAYICYTSGSTGVPKGVMISHQNLQNLWETLKKTVYAHIGCHGIRVAQNALSVFDASVQQWLALLGGHTLLPIPETQRTDPTGFVDWLKESRPQLMDCTPTMIRLLLDAGADQTLAGMTVIVGGELIDQALWERLAQLKATRFINVYGPTECTVDATSIEIGDKGQMPSIGRPIANSLIRVLDKHRQPAAAGLAGELLIGGACLGRGYCGRPDLTAERFIPDPFAPTPGARLYRTGDLGRFLSDGNLEILGRLDFQLKLYGFRIELEEIEAAIQRHPYVKNCAVVARSLNTPSTYLAAFAVLKAEAPKNFAIDVALREFLGESLPLIMIPARFIVLKSLPMSLSGKVDRKALPQLDAAPSQEHAFREPRTFTEVAIAGIWAKVLELEEVSADASFFSLGGHSLLAAQIVSRINHALAINLSIRDLFDNPTICRVAARAEVLQRGGEGLEPPPPLQPIDHREPIPLSFAQLRLWLIDQLYPGTPVYNLSLAESLSGPICVQALNQALTQIVARHQTLRTCFPQRNGEPVQQVQEPSPITMPVIDMSGFPPEAREAACRRLPATLLNHRFDLAQGPLFRPCLLKRDCQSHVLLIIVHHIVSDAWSTEILRNELHAFYRLALRQTCEAPPPPAVQYVDYTVWQRRYLTEEALQARGRYWRNHLQGELPILNLPCDFPRPAVLSAWGETCKFTLDANLCQALQNLGGQHESTLFVTLLAGWQVLLARYCRQDDLCIGVPVAGRDHVQLEGLIGFFVNTIVMRGHLSQNPSVGELLDNTRQTALNAFAHQDFPFERLVEMLQPGRDTGNTPLFQAMFNLQEHRKNCIQDDGSAPVFTSCPVRFDLSLTAHHMPGAIHMSIEYRTDLHRRETISRLVESFTVLLADMAARPRTRIAQLQLLSGPQREQVLVACGQPPSKYPGHTHILAAFQQQAVRAPHRIAAVFTDHAVTYQYLGRQVDRLAHRLQAQGVTRESRVGVLMFRSIEMLIALYAAVKAGAAYVPLDPEYPSERLHFMLDDARVSVVLTHRAATHALPDHVNAPVLDLDTPSPASPVQAEIIPHPAQPVYMIYTSGSTGRPKGVVNTHGALHNRLMWMQDALALDACDTVLQKTPFSFDVSVWELFWPLMYGARLEIAAPGGHRDGGYLAQTITQRLVTTTHFVPPMLSVFLDCAHAEDLTALKRVICSGEALPVSVCRRFKDHAPHTQLVNLYGPTEAAIDVSCFEWDADPTRTTVPIGKPIGNTQLYVLDTHENPVPIGVQGELHIGGLNLARGYFDRPGLTASSFIPDHLHPEPGRRLYKTGDLAYLGPDRCFYFIARLDFQVKLHGFRIELGEIEAVLQRHKDVAAAAVLPIESKSLGKRLVAYVVGTAVTESMRLHAASHLPDFMVPAQFVTLESLPLSPNGKLDRRALIQMTPDVQSAPPYAEPSTPWEKSLADMWCTVLNIPAVGRDDNFFDLGGHSLNAVVLTARIARELNRKLPLFALFEHPTLRQMAGFLESSHRAAAPQILVPLRTQGSAVPIFCVHPIGGMVLSYRELARKLGDNQPFYAIQSPILEGTETLDNVSIRALATRYNEAVQKAFPRGPYRLMGWSLGGVIAWEMAAQLVRAKQAVSQLVLLDSRLHDSSSPATDEIGLLQFFALDLAGRYGFNPERLNLPTSPHLKEWLNALHAYLHDNGHHITKDVLARQFAVFQAHAKAASAYQASPYRGQATLVCAQAKSSLIIQQQTKAWQSLGTVTIHQTPGDHYSILQGENLSAWINALNLSNQ